MGKFKDMVSMQGVIVILEMLALLFPLQARAQDKDTLLRDTLRASVTTAFGNTLLTGGSRKVSFEEVSLQITPMGEGDVIHYVQTLPGVSSGAEGSSSIYVRGGSASGNILSLDGVRLYAKSHLMGFLPVYPSEIVQSSYFTVGGFTSDDNNLTSSHIRLLAKEGGFTNCSVSASVSNTIAGVSISSPLIRKRLSILASVRISPVQLGYFAAKKWIQEASSISDLSLFAGDAYVKLMYRISEKGSLSLFCFNSLDRYRTDLNESSEFHLHWSEVMAGLRWIRNGTLVSHEALVSVNGFGTGQNQRSILRQTNNYLEISSGIQEWQGKYSISLRNLTPFGLKVGLIGSFNRSLIGSSVNIEGSEYLSNAFFSNASRDPISSWRNVLFIEGGFTFGNRLALQMMGRANQYRSSHVMNQYISKDGEYSARIHLSPIQPLSIVGTIDHLVQYDHTLEGLPLGWPLDIIAPSTSRMPRESADQLYAGCEFQYSGWIASIGVFRKSMESLVYFKRSSAIFSPAIGNWERETSIGSGSSRGLETQIEKGEGRLKGRAVYTWSKADRQFSSLNGGKPFPAKFDRTHVFHLNLVYDLVDKEGKKVSLDSYLTYQSGNYETVPAGEYTDYTLEGYPVTIVYTNSTVNNYRMPSYFRWDAGIRFEKKSGDRSKSLLLGVYNLTNRHNPFMIIYDSDETEWKQVSLLPIMPSISCRISF